MTLLIAVAMGIAIWLAAAWAIRLLATPPPPEPDPDDVHEISIDYRCTICGLQLTVTAAQDGELSAPKHCREEMVPTG